MEISKITNPDEWAYFAKGNANMLFTYHGSNTFLKHKLLRVRLYKDDDKYISSCELYDFVELKCKALFPKEVTEIQLVVLTASFVESLQSNGHKLMVKEKYGLLIPNMLDVDYTKVTLLKNVQLYYDTEAVMFEIKPKWLYDNNSSNYCRTCLMNQYKGFKRHFCPLDLLHKERFDQVIDDILDPVPPSVLSAITKNKFPVVKLLQSYLENPVNVFQKLKNYQQIEKHTDLIKNLSLINDVLNELSLIMTLRDVGVFIKFEKFTKNSSRGQVMVVENSEFLVTCNIYDLDLKSNMRFEHWIEVDEKLRGVRNTPTIWKQCLKFDGEGLDPL